MEKLIHTRLSWYLEHHLHLSPTQFGFRKEKSCADNLSLISTDIWTGFVEKKVTAILFLDLKGAFPSVIPQILIEDLKEIDTPFSIAKFIYNMIACKQIFFNINGELVGPRMSTVGLPQGCILSPILYSIYTRKLHLILPPNCKIVEFADDIAIITKHKDPNECSIALQNCLNILSEFLSSRGLEICPQKTKLVLFNKLKIDFNNNNLHLKINNFNIVPVTHVKFLGIILDYELSFNQHFSYLLEKLYKILNIIKYLRGTWWGAHPFTLLTIYRALIRSCIEYGCHIFCFKNEKLFNKLEILRNSAIRLALGYRMSTPINVMLAETCEPLFKPRFFFLTKKYLLKVSSNRSHPLTDNLKKLKLLTSQKNSYKAQNTFILLSTFLSILPHIQQIRKAYLHPYYEFPYSNHLFTPKIEINLGYTIQNSVKPPLLFKDIINNEFKDYLCFYTDGSKSISEKTAGCATVCPSNQIKQSWKINEEATIFSIEAFAIFLTLDYIVKNNHKKVAIFSDSLSVLKSISAPNPINIKSYIIYLIRNRLATLETLHYEITLIWIPAHLGLEGNEIADEAAKLASESAPPLNIDLPHSDLTTKFKECLTNKSQEYYLTRGRSFGTYYTQKFYRYRKKPWFASLNIKREWIVSICRMRSNHHSLNESLYRKNIIQSPACPCNPETEEDLEHVLWNCPRFDNIRPKLIERLTRTFKCYAPFSSEVFLTEPSPTIISYIFDFLKETKLKI